MLLLNERNDLTLSQRSNVEIIDKITFVHKTASNVSLAPIVNYSIKISRTIKATTVVDNSLFTC